jgi:hypothetical protein
VHPRGSLRGGTDAEEGRYGSAAGAGAASPDGHGRARGGAAPGDEPEHRAGLPPGARRGGPVEGRDPGPAHAGAAQGRGRRAAAEEAAAAASVVARAVARADRGGVAEGRRPACDLRRAAAPGRELRRGKGHALRGQAGLRPAEARPGRPARGRSHPGGDASGRGRPGGLRLRRSPLRPACSRDAQGVGLRDGARLQPAHVCPDRLQPDHRDMAAAPRRGVRGAGRRGPGGRARRLRSFAPPSGSTAPPRSIAAIESWPGTATSRSTRHRSTTRGRRARSSPE